NGLRAVDNESGANIACLLTDNVEIEQRAIGPMHGRNRDDGRVPINGTENPGVPAFTARKGLWRRNHPNFGAGIHSGLPPCIHIAWKVAAHEYEILTSCDRSVSYNRCYAV